MGAAINATAIAFLDHNFPSGTTVTVYKGTSPPANTPVANVIFGTNSNPRYVLFGGTHNERYWRVAIPVLTGSVIPQLGELMLGIPQIPTMAPTIEHIRATNRSNVRRDESPAGYTWAVRRGARRDRFTLGWNYTTLAAERTAIFAAISETFDTSKKFLWVDDFGVVRWANWLTTDLEMVPQFDEIWQIRELILEDAL
jgi:hypothetical protein